MIDPKEVFKALPHVQTIWVTEDGHFHLHSANGGKRIDRDELNTSDLDVKEPEQEIDEPEQPAASSEEPEQEIDEPEQPAKEPHSKRVYKRRK